MLLDDVHLDSMTEAHLQTLVDNKVQEGKRIEYKVDRPAVTDDQKKKLLIQVCSFANANGGFLLYGVDAPHGVPIGLPGFDVEDADTEKQRVANVIRDGSDPRIWGVNLGMTRLGTGKWVLTIHIPQSFNPPHMVTLGGERRFYSRGPAGKYPLDVGELRTIFGFAETVARRVRDFRAERLAAIRNGETPVPLLEGMKLVLHMIPFDSFALGRAYDLSSFSDSPETLPNIGWKVYSGRYNFDGFVSCAHNLWAQNAPPRYSYTQCFRNGIFEALHMRYDPREEGSVKKVLNIGYEDMVAKAVRAFLALQKRMGTALPVFVLMSFLDVKGVVMTGSQEFEDILLDSTPFSQDNVILPEIVIEDFQSDVAARMRPIFDIVRNAVGMQAKG